MEILSSVLDALNTCNEGFWLLCLANQLMEKRKWTKEHEKWIMALTLLGYLILILCVNQIVLVSPYTVFVAILYMLVVISVIWKNNVLIIMAVVNAYYMMLMLFSILMLSVVSWLGGEELIELTMEHQGVQRLILIVFVGIIWMLLNWGFQRFIRRYIWKNSKNYILIMSSIGIVGSVYIGEQFLYNFNVQVNFLSYVFLVLLIIAFYGSYSMFKYRELQHTQATMLLQRDFLEKRYEELNQHYLSNRKILHDEKNHFHAIYSIASKNNDKGVMEYVESILEELKQSEVKIWTGLDVVDSILSKNMALARGRDINFIINTKMIPLEIQLKNWELCSLFSNLLNNCMEANPQNVELQIGVQGNMLYIQCVNDYQIVPQKIEEKYRSSKRDFTEYGMGLKSIEDIAEKYKGFARYEDKEGFFSVVVSLELMENAETED